MDAVKISTGRFYRPELDVVRFLAFLAVFLCHTLPSDNGDPRILKLIGVFTPAYCAFAGACRYGLSLFFTLSAFLICELLLRERDASGTVHVKQFYIRRILRIWPLYYFGLALGVFFAFLPGGHSEELSKFGWFVVFLGAWNTSLFGWIKNPIIALWSISVEEQFYLFAPWIVKFFSRKMLYIFCGALILVANGWLYFLGRVMAYDYRVWADSFVQFECFSAGILLCLALRGRIPRIAPWERLILLTCAVCSWFISVHTLHANFGVGENPGSWPLIGGYALAAIGSVLVLVAFLGVNPKLLPGWAIHLGRISFGLYVFHEFAISLTIHLPFGALLFKTVSNYPIRICLNAGLTLGLPVGLTLLMAEFSYRYIETPFLKMKKRHTVIESQPILGAS